MTFMWPHDREAISGEDMIQVCRSEALLVSGRSQNWEPVRQELLSGPEPPKLVSQTVFCQKNDPKEKSDCFFAAFLSRKLGAETRVAVYL